MHEEINNEYKIVEMQPQITICLEDKRRRKDNIKMGHNINNVLGYGPGLSGSIQFPIVSFFCILNKISVISYSKVSAIAVTIAPFKPELHMNYSLYKKQILAPQQTKYFLIDTTPTHALFFQHYTSLAS